MKSNVSLEEGLRNLRNVLKDVGGTLPKWNEADTRFHFIDRLLTECLGWARSTIKNELRFDGEYLDYALGEPVEVVWEAKRSGVHFEVPADANRAAIQSLEAISAVSKSAEDAIRQVQGYCNSAGVEFAVVCNGPQLIAFIAQRIGSSWLRGKALVSRDLDHLLEDFPLFWQCLSPDGIFERRLASKLGYGTESNIPAKLSTRLLRYPAFRYKTQIQANLRAISELLIEDVVLTSSMKKRFYNECYCDTGALSRDSLISQRTLQARYASLFPPEDGTPTMEPAGSNENEHSLSSQILTEAMAKRPIVLLGDVGVGKTSFLEDLIYIRAESEFRKALTLYIDLGSTAALAVDIRKFVVRDIERQLLSTHCVDIQEEAFVRGVYDLDIKRFRNSFKASLAKGNEGKLAQATHDYIDQLLSDRPGHLRRSIEHIALGRRQQIIFILDNADQRRADIQQEAFIIAQEFAQSWNAIVLSQFVRRLSSNQKEPAPFLRIHTKF
jgi:GTPase SAR1 family protein